MSKERSREQYKHDDCGDKVYAYQFKRGEIVKDSNGMLYRITKRCGRFKYHTVRLIDNRRIKVWYDEVFKHTQVRDTKKKVILIKAS